MKSTLTSLIKQKIPKLAVAVSKIKSFLNSSSIDFKTIEKSKGCSENKSKSIEMRCPYFNAKAVPPTN